MKRMLLQTVRPTLTSLEMIYVPKPARNPHKNALICVRLSLNANHLPTSKVEMGLSELIKNTICFSL